MSNKTLICNNSNTLNDVISKLQGCKATEIVRILPIADDSLQIEYK